MFKNALSIDLEDWFHPELIRKYITNSQRISYVESSTEILLKLLDKYNIKATFFIVGEVALDNPQLIKKIYSTGHEIACHGFSHKPLSEIGPEGLKNELKAFKEAINGILGSVEIKGFRAPTFSLDQNTAWVVDILKEFNFKYDSSIFPMRLGIYGVNRAPLDIYGLNANDLRYPDDKSILKEFPLTLFEFAKIRFPVSGGFYLRAMPLCLQKRVLKSINKKRPFIIYLHPWECDADIPRIKTNIISGFITYYNKKAALVKLEELLKIFKFDRIDHILGV